MKVKSIQYQLPIMANAKGKTVDTTYLSLENAEKRGFLHRDYIAHCLRWSHVIKRLQEKKAFSTARILDVGCGRELPLPSTLYSSRFIVEQYYGVDVGPINDSAMDKFHSGKFPLQCFEKTDVCNITLDHLGNRPVNWVTCFEVLEHVEPDHMIRMLNHIKSLMAPDGIAFFSTPCWNMRDVADNHVNEMKYEVLGAVFEENGWTVQRVHGTFASIADYKHLLKEVPGLQGIFDSLRGYYDVNFLSCIFAPLFPANSRNCLWEVTPSKDLDEQHFKPLNMIEKPWGSSEHWK